MNILFEVIKWYSVIILSIVEISLAIRIMSAKDTKDGVQTIISFILFAPILLLVVYLFNVQVY